MTDENLKGIFGDDMYGGKDVTVDQGDLAPLLRALVALQLELLRDKPDAPKPEVLLQRAGLGIAEIAELTGRNYAATAKILSRAKAASKGGANE